MSGTSKGYRSESLTASFDHEIVDGAPAARFMKDFTELTEGGTLISEEI